MNDLNDICVIFFKCSILYGAKVSLQKYVLFLFLLHDKFYISESKLNESTF